MLYEYNCIIRSVTDGDGLRVDIDLGLVSLFAVTMVGGLTFAFMELMHPSLALEIRRRSCMGYSQKNASRRNVRLEERTSLERKRGENLVAGWEISKRQKDGLRSSFSKQSWLSRTKGRIRKKLKQLTKRTVKS